ncbi:MAG: hypothetical protein A2Y98_02910 [Candidatus Portnoybacteria bacterium RBG_19FT_COMBO_36_7]|uniref:GAF domain-containing protein n=1 Tax=Candidatus Portnoybacteria bacterium RBG_19FT_COMBO_36_7 TaxID=1801992 RepID=A0A1G2FAV9_9BACT|nr:MAG: hypothetical protein A2Y98_02910 [Candidatus Portnoybacteria bacterium RBG_19FT_COMBO_36_7]
MALELNKKIKEVKKMGFEGTIQEMADQLIEDFEAERCTIRSKHKSRLKLVVARGVNLETRRDEIEITGTIAGDALLTGKIQNVPDITKDERYDPSYVVHNGAKALMAIPILFEGQFLCVAQIYRKDFFSDKDRSFAKTLARHMAFTLRHIEISKLNRQATLDIFVAILGCETFQEAFMCIVKEVSEHLEIPRCLIYRIQTRNRVRWCEIVAGVPQGEHEIGLSDPLSKHPDIEAATEGKQTVEINEPLGDERTKHLRPIIENKQINSILEVPIVSGKEAIGVIVLDATQEKEGFSSEEKSFCYDVSRIVGCLLDHERKRLGGIADKLINSSSSLGLFAKRLMIPLTTMYELAEECEALKNCANAQKITETTGKLLALAARLQQEAENIDHSYFKIRETQL